MRVQRCVVQGSLMNQLVFLPKKRSKIALSKRCEEKVFIAGKKRLTWLQNSTFNLSKGV